MPDTQTQKPSLSFWKTCILFYSSSHAFNAHILISNSSCECITVKKQCKLASRERKKASQIKFATKKNNCEIRSSNIDEDADDDDDNEEETPRFNMVMILKWPIRPL